MSYTVVWKEPAKEQLAEIWMAAPNRAAVTQAADEIDARLRQAPFETGESREEEHRIAFVKPLVVEYAVSEADRKVSIAHVRLM